MTKIRDAASVTLKPPAEPRPLHPRPRTGRAANQPQTVVRVHPAVLELALELAEGDRGRLTINRDGSVTVTNHTRSHR